MGGDSTAGFRSWSRKGWEFESPRSHKGCEVMASQADANRKDLARIKAILEST